MSTAWTLPAQAIIRDAMEHMNNIGADEIISPEDYDLCMRGLQGVLKELPVHGFSWPQVTVAPVSLAWSALTPDIVALPADYFGVPTVSYVLNDVSVPVRIVSKADYQHLLESVSPSQIPPALYMYIAADFTAHLYPVPTVDPQLLLTYQAIVPDAVQTQVPHLPQTWVLFIGLWVAWELSNKFSVPPERRDNIEKRYLLKRELCLSYATETAPICIQVQE